MIDWDQLLSRPHLVCAVSGDAIVHGATFYSLLRWHENRFQRIDISADSWSPELAEGAISWWRQTRAAERIAEGPRLLSPEILFGVFRDCALSSERPRQCLAWLLAWLLIRMRFLKFVDLVKSPDQSLPDHLLVITKASQGKESMRLRDPQMTSEEETLLQAQVDDLFADSAQAAD